MIEIGIAKTENDFNGILELQALNHVEQVSPTVHSTQGFVTVRHDLRLLKDMAYSTPQIIAKKDGNIIGFALVMTLEFADRIPVLLPMFKMLETLSFEERPLTSYSYYIMGQVCIAESFRGQGLFEQLYAEHKTQLSAQYDLCVTEVSLRNPRSMRAHEKVGFEVIHSFEDNADSWKILAWDWH
jgi:predicted GNAT superfamily acetyltransferase